MKGPSVSVLKKYLNAMSKKKVKYMTCERLSNLVGVYPEVIAENLSFRLLKKPICQFLHKSLHFMLI